MHISVHFAWYDMWIGAYWNRASRTLYICPLPMLMVKIRPTRSLKRRQRSSGRS